MKEQVRVIVDYEIEWDTLDSRDHALAIARECGTSTRGKVAGGAFRATRLGLTVSGGTELTISKQELLDGER